MSPGRVRGMGLVPEPKRGRGKKRKHKSEPAEGLCKAANPGLAAAATGGIWVLSWGWGTQIKAGGTQLGPRAMTVTAAETQRGGEEGDRAQGDGPRALSVTLAG